MKRSNSKILLGVFITLMATLVGQIAGATEVYINDFSNFPKYEYNTGLYKQGGAFVGCGPTSGAMVLGYFQNENANSNFLKNNIGLDTAWALHGSAYMNTAADGFGSVLDIKPGMENYVGDLSPVIIGNQKTTYSLNVMVHVSPIYNASNPGSTATDPLGWNAYGAFGTAWTNDAAFFYEDASSKWHIDASKFESWANTRLVAGTPIWVTVDTDGIKGGDHWIPLVGYNDVDHLYAYYNTFDTAIHWAPIKYVTDEGSGNYGITAVRDFTLSSVTETTGGPIVTPEPGTMLLLGSGLIGLFGMRRKIRK